MSSLTPPNSGSHRSRAAHSVTFRPKRSSADHPLFDLVPADEPDEFTFPFDKPTATIFGGR